MKQKILMLSLIALFVSTGILLALFLPASDVEQSPELPALEPLPVVESAPQKEKQLFLTLAGNFLVVYEDNTRSHETERVEIVLQALPSSEVEQLQRGFFVTPEQLKHLIEDYTS